MSGQTVSDLWQKRVTIKCERIHVEEMLQRLTDQTGLYFVYSSSIVEVDKTISFVAHERPLGEVLDILGKQLGLDFRRKGEYIIIKKIAATALLVSAPHRTREVRPRSVESRKIVPGPEKTFPENTVADSTTSFRSFAGPSRRTVNDSCIFCRDLLRWKKDFAIDTNAWKKFTVRTVDKLTPRQPRQVWFVSAGFFVNDYSGGTEIQAGIRPLYAVVNASLLSDGNLHKGFGLGSSFALSSKFAVNPVWSYATVKEQNDFLKVSARHQQSKIMVQYSITRNIALRAGPTFNVVRATYTVDHLEAIAAIKGIQVSGIQVSSPAASSSAASAGAERMDMVYFKTMPYTVKIIQRGHNVVYARGGHDVIRSWVGFEASLSYSLKFFSRR
jgi:hypothetical protein